MADQQKKIINGLLFTIENLKTDIHSIHNTLTELEKKLTAKDKEIEKLRAKAYEGFAKITQSLDYAERGSISMRYGEALKKGK